MGRGAARPSVLKQGARIDERELREFARGWMTSERINAHHKPLMMHADLDVRGWLLKQSMRIMPEPVIVWMINRSIERISKAANAICLKDYSSFLRSR
jgi:hypothetical protein